MSNIRELVEKELNSQDLESLETLSEWWIEHEFEENMWESKEEYRNRQEMVIPLIIDAKLRKHEEEYV